MNQNQTSETHHIEARKLDRSPLNVRRTTKTNGLDDLKASILAHGLMQNLVVTANGSDKYHVIAGGRRLEAIQSLQKEGKLPSGYSVPCQIVADERAEELSLAENVVRVAMHPADEFEAYAGLAEKGDDAAAIAERFGVTEKHVLQRLKLARVAPELVEEYRAENLDLECLTAFALTDDRKRQLAVYRSLQGWQVGNADHIRRTLTEKLVKADSKFAAFVGREAYEAAGGTVRSDLFGEEVFFEEPELLNRLVGEKLEGIRQKIEIEGWGWVQVQPEEDYQFVHQCGRLRPTPTDVPPELSEAKTKVEAELEALRVIADSEEELGDEHFEQEDALEERLSEIRDRIGEYVSFDPQKMKSAGCYVTIAHDGKLRVERGLVKKEDQRKAKDKAEPDAKAEKPKAEMSQALRQDLELFRLQVARCEIASNPAIAFDLLVYHAACEVLNNEPLFDGPDVHFNQKSAVPSIEGEAPASAQFEKIGAALPLDWLKGKTEAEQFERFRQLPDNNKQKIMAFCVASTLRASLAPSSPKDATGYDAALALTGADVAEYWRPSKENYLSRLTREQLLGIGKELLGKSWAVECGGLKKNELVDKLHTTFASPDKHGETAQQVAQLKSWLPPGMSFGGLIRPKPGKAKPAKKGRRAA